MRNCAKRTDKADVSSLALKAAVDAVSMSAIFPNQEDCTIYLWALAIPSLKDQSSLEGRRQANARPMLLKLLLVLSCTPCMGPNAVQPC
jgi:hypothetical protein